MKKILIVAAVFAVLMLGSCKEILWNNIEVVNNCSFEIKVSISKTTDASETGKTISKYNSVTFYLDNYGAYYDISVESGSGLDATTFTNIYIHKNGTFIISWSGVNYTFTKSW